MNTAKFNDHTYTPSKIVCIGRNYPGHIKEMKSEKPTEPIIFIKANSALKNAPKEISVPSSFGLLHHEIELCFLVNKECKALDNEEAKKAIAGYSVGIDFTLRELQTRLKKSKGPWALPKGFDSSAIIGEFISSEKVKNPCSLSIVLKVNSEKRQDSNTKNMIFSPWEILSFVSKYMTLNEGDIFMCGTPGGVGPVENEDLLMANISRLPELKFKVFRE